MRNNMDSIYLLDWEKSVLTDDAVHPALLAFQDRSINMHNCLSTELVELITNICDELSLSSEVEFTCLDNFAVYCRQQYAQILAQTANVSTGNANRTQGSDSGLPHKQADECSSGHYGGLCQQIRNAPSAFSAASSLSSSSAGAAAATTTTTNCSMTERWRMLCERFAHDAPVRLVAVLMLSAKMIGVRPIQSLSLRPIVTMLRSLRPEITLQDIKLAENEVFHALHFTIKPSLTYRSLDLFLGHSERHLKVHPNADLMPYIRSKALMILRIVYMIRPEIYEQFTVRNSRLDAAVFGELMNDRQRHLCLTVAIVTCAFLFAEQSVSVCTELTRVLGRVAGLPMRQLSQMVQIITEAVQYDQTPMRLPRSPCARQKSQRLAVVLGGCDSNDEEFAWMDDGRH